MQKWYYNAFTIIWNAGLRDALLTAKNTYPSYELWVTGLSLGGGLSSLAAPYISQMGYFDKYNIKLLNFGAMRVGKPDFVSRFPSLVPWAYRLVHRYDIVPHWFQNFGFINYAKEVDVFSTNIYMFLYIKRLCSSVCTGDFFMVNSKSLPTHTTM